MRGRRRKLKSGTIINDQFSTPKKLCFRKKNINERMIDVIRTYLHNINPALRL